MKRRIFVGVLFLSVLAFKPVALTAQDPRDNAPARTEDSGFELQQNYPNPFNPTTRIPFRLDPRLFDEGHPVVVTMAVYNVLQQLVAYPTALDHPDGNGVQVRRLSYDTPGEKEAFWDGHDLDGRQVASGIYYVQLIVNGRRQIMKMIVAK